MGCGDFRGPCRGGVSMGFQAHNFSENKHFSHRYSEEQDLFPKHLIKFIFYLMVHLYIGVQSGVFLSFLFYCGALIFILMFKTVIEDIYIIIQMYKQNFPFALTGNSWLSWLVHADSYFILNFADTLWTTFGFC